MIENMTIAEARAKLCAENEQAKKVIDALRPFWIGEVDFGKPGAPESELSGMMRAGVKLAEEIYIRAMLKEG